MEPSTSPWVDGLTVGQALAETVRRFPDHEALVSPGLSYRRSYASFQEAVDEIARALMALGIRPGDHVGLWATNLPQWVLIQFASAQIGSVLVNVNPAYRTHELEYVLNQADITALLLTDRFKTSDYFEMVRGICPEIIASQPGRLDSARCPKLRSLISLKPEKTAGMLSWGEFRALAERVQPADVVRRRSGVKPGDVANIQYTSGTTGFPKGAMLTHRNLLMNAFFVGQRMGFSERDRLCIPVPFYHCFGCVMGTLMCSVYGATMVVPGEVFDPEATLRAIQDERCTAVYGVPTMFIAELQHPRFTEFSLGRLRTGIMAGSPCPIEVMRQVVDRMGAREMTIAYGLTESSPVITQTETTDSLEHRVSTVGKRLPGLEVQIVVPGTLRALPPGEPGELLVRGHGVMKGYYKKPRESEEAITPDGWLHTGDLAVETPEGYYRITGRIKDMIIRGGENIYPREIEEFLHTHPLVADVQVVGLPDEKYGEEVSAWIRLKPQGRLTEKDLQEYCRGRIAHYKIPRYACFVEDYPKTVTGKVQKYKLREMGIEKFGLEKAAAIRTA